MKSQKEIMAKKTELMHLTYANEVGLGFRILFEEDNLTFTPQEVVAAKEMWKKGIHVADIARNLERPEKEVVLLIVELAYSGEVKPRPGALAGNEWRANN